MAPGPLITVLVALLRLGSGAPGPTAPGAPSPMPAHSLSDAGPWGFGSLARNWWANPVPIRVGPAHVRDGTLAELQHALSLSQLSILVSAVSFVMMASLLCFMMGQGGQNDDGPHRGFGTLNPEGPSDMGPLYGTACSEPIHV